MNTTTGGAILTEAEKDREASCITVACPVCGSRPGRRCSYGLSTSRRSRWNVCSHTGRYLAAVDAGLVPPLTGDWRG